jgi:hypothetical protein
MAAAKQSTRVEDLSPAAQTIVERKRVTSRRRLKEWLDVFKEIADFDEAVKPLCSRAGALGGIFGIIAIVTLLLTVLVTYYAALAAIPSGALAVYYGMRWRRFRSVALVNDFEVVVLPFLRIIAEDVDQDARISLKLDMSGPTDDKIITTKEMPPGRFKKVIQTIHRDPWCHLNVPLAEGSRLLLTVTNTYLSEDRRWKNARRKSKRRVKWKKVVKVTAGLIPNGRNTEFDQKAVRAGTKKERLKLAEKKHRTVARLTRTFKFKAVNQLPQESVSAKELVQMFFQLGSLLEPVRTKGS